VDHELVNITNSAFATAALVAAVAAAVVASVAAAGAFAAGFAALVAAARGLGNADFFAHAAILVLRDLFRFTPSMAHRDQPAAAVRAALFTTVATAAARFRAAAAAFAAARGGLP